MGNEPPKISVIVPVYNVATYIGNCLSSLVHQSFQDFEIITVNDGSTDSSLSVLHDFESCYNFIKVIDQPNRGVSAARSAGLSQAKGEYICFVDSDDYVAPRYLEKLYQSITDYNADIACCNYFFRFETSGFTMAYPFACSGVFNRTQAMHKLVEDIQIQGFLWNKMFRKSLFAENNIDFPCMCFEDVVIANQVFSHANRVVCTMMPLYFYQQRRSSTLNTMNARKINDIIHALAMVRLGIETRGDFENYEDSFKVLCSKTTICVFYYTLQMHIRKRCLTGCITNMKKASRAIKHYSSDEFSPNMTFGKLPDVVGTPELEENYSTR